MDDAKRAKTEERIKLMIKKAESTTPAEAEMIMEQVERLMIKLGLDDLNALMADDTVTGQDIVSVQFDFDGVYARSYVTMVHHIISGMGNLSGVMLKKANKRTGRYTDESFKVYGFKHDVDRAKILVDSLLLQCVNATTQFVKNNGSYMTASQKYNAKRSFIVGFGSGAGSRIKRNRLTVYETAAAGTDIVVANVKKRINDEIERLHSTKPVRSMKMTANGFHDGYSAGENARTGETSIGQRKSIAG